MERFDVPARRALPEGPAFEVEVTLPEATQGAALLVYRYGPVPNAAPAPVAVEPGTTAGAWKLSVGAVDVDEEQFVTKNSELTDDSLNLTDV